ncbi:NAD(P)-binding domain-containing protein [Alloscardovia sp. HMSC034E08]|uniref:NAD(P)-binding domain-containing protein n=1 Tax=Alloscardovia sp. HMSC034E08 TaxID=1739413 RepID=UPI001FED57C3|nr:NAD(P)-binding domain-containing protein [Alloscardovia sp. HMSC034E08]
MNITIFGKDNMGKAIGGNLEINHTVHYYGSADTVEQLGDLVILAVPFPTIASIAQQYKQQLAGKVVVDISNPLNFET